MRCFTIICLLVMSVIAAPASMLSRWWGVSGGGAEAFSLSGGTTTTNGGYIIHTFTSSDTLVVTGSGEVDVLKVGGGGDYGVYYSTPAPKAPGGGGGGEVTLSTNLSVTVGSYSVVVGLGGTANNNGTSSSVFGASASGGDVGYRLPDFTRANGGDSGDGHTGGIGWAASATSGSGAGDGANGISPATSTQVCNGGSGSSVWGTYYAGGGGNFTGPGNNGTPGNGLIGQGGTRNVRRGQNGTVIIRYLQP